MRGIAFEKFAGRKKWLFSDCLYRQIRLQDGGMLMLLRRGRSTVVRNGLEMGCVGLPYKRRLICWVRLESRRGSHSVGMNLESRMTRHLSEIPMKTPVESFKRVLQDTRKTFSGVKLPCSNDYHSCLLPYDDDIILITGKMHSHF
jgi:hypothetical protein